MLATISRPLSAWGGSSSRSMQHQCSHSEHNHQDCLQPGYARPLTYSRLTFPSSTDDAAQMADHYGDAYPSAQFTSGGDFSAQQVQWTADLGSIPKDCYFCKTSYGEVTGKCTNDAPQWGSGKDINGHDCSRCSGTGKCPHCGGDGMIG